MSLLPNEPQSEPDTDDESTDTDEYLTAADTPFKRVIRSTVAKVNHYILQDAVDFHEDIEHRGNAYNDDFEQACTTPPTNGIGNPYDSEKRYWTAVAPTLATSESVEWVGAMGVDLDTDAGKSKTQLREYFTEQFGDAFSDDVIGTAVSLYITIRENQREYNRRTSLQELKAPKWSSGPRNASVKEQAFNRLLPRLEAIKQPTRKDKPDWEWGGS